MGAGDLEATLRPFGPFFADTEHRVAVFGPLLLSIWIGETRVEALRAMEQMIDAAAHAAPHGRLGLFVIVDPMSTPPAGPARAELARIRRTSPIALTALVYGGNGFAAALVRGITTSLNLLAAADRQTHVFADVTSAARWLEATAPEYGLASEVEAAVVKLRTYPD